MIFYLHSILHRKWNLSKKKNMEKIFIFIYNRFKYLKNIFKPILNEFLRV